MADLVKRHGQEGVWVVINLLPGTPSPWWWTGLVDRRMAPVGTADIGKAAQFETPEQAIFNWKMICYNYLPQVQWLEVIFRRQP